MAIRRLETKIFKYTQYYSLLHKGIVYKSNISRRGKAIPLCITKLRHVSLSHYSTNLGACICDHTHTLKNSIGNNSWNCGNNNTHKCSRKCSFFKRPSESCIEYTTLLGRTSQRCKASLAEQGNVGSKTREK